MNLQQIIKEVKQNHTPHAWDRVVLKLVPELSKRGIKLHKFNGDIEIDQDLLALINQKLIDLYGKGLQTI